MRCPSCAAEVDVSGVFPGGTLSCACGATIGVPSPSKRPAPNSSADVDPPTRRLEWPNACPRCHVGLELRDAEGIAVVACPAEHGLFVTHAALRKVTSAGVAVAVALDQDLGAAIAHVVAPAAHITCPRCGGQMRRRSLAKGVVVDICDEHGTWFDAGELRALLQARESTGRERAEEGGSALDRSVRESALPEAHVKQAKATLDVALALEQARETETLRRGVDAADDLLDTFNFLVLGRGSRRRKLTW